MLHDVTCGVNMTYRISVGAGLGWTHLDLCRGGEGKGRESGGVRSTWREAAEGGGIARRTVGKGEGV